MNEAQILGRIKRSAFETVGRTDSWSEQRVLATTIVGKVDDLRNRVKPGDSMVQLSGWLDGDWEGDMFVRTTDLTSTDGQTAELRLSMLKCPKGKTKPYNVTWDVSMEEVQMPLISHPDILANANMDNLIKWEDTRKGVRAQKRKGEESGGLEAYDFFYYDFSNYSLTQNDYVPVKITNKWEIAYCRAVMCGITTYNRYMPVIVKNSYYLEIEGADYDSNRIITGGTMSEFTKRNVIGSFNEPELKIDGYTSKEGVWFKNGDKYTSSADGTWTRTESWVFTNDVNHKWIYTHKLD